MILKRQIDIFRGKKESLWKNTTIAFTVFLIIKLLFKDWPKTSRHITIKIRLKYFLKKKT